jgi:hypothetical protein
MSFIIPANKILNLGSYPNDGTGDDLYTAFDKVKTTLGLISDGLNDITGQNLGAGTKIYVDNTTNILQFKTLTSTKLTITNTANTVNIEGLGRVQDDTTPRLGGTLSLNSNNITGNGNINISGNVDLTGLINGVDIEALRDIVFAGGSGGGGDVDFGAFDTPAPGDTDFGTFI